MAKYLYLYIFTIISLLLFLYGFFPMQNTSPKDSIHPTHLKEIEFNLSELYKPELDRLIFIIIDALRWDFVTESNFPFLVSAFHKNGCMCKVHVQSPTVTLPRIKALTTGRVPQFLDVVLNLIGTSTLNDSILHQAKAAGKKIIFYGDDTWLKLYPTIFQRSEGVSSFFVNDFIEVDDNVTYNIKKELYNSDWDLMFLHYLGLDHIGHVFGPFSTLIQPKLLEMDSIIKNIYFESKFWNKKTLIVVTGDHGMKDSGGHGGATEAETHVPLITLGMSCKNDSIKQIDIPTTLSVLLGIKIPSGSVGKAALNMLIDLPQERRLYILHYVSSLLKSVSTYYENIFENASNFHYNFLLTKKLDNAVNAELYYQDYLHKVSERLLQSVSEQDEHILSVCFLIIVNCLCVNLLNLCNVDENGTKFTKIIPFILIFQLTLRLPILTAIFVIILVCFLILHLIKILKCVKRNYSFENIFVTLCTILYMISLQSSSFIEEEHQTWYFFFGSIVLLTSYNIKNLFKSMQVLSLFICVRFIRTLNPAGDKWSHLPTLSQWLLLEENYLFLHLLFCVSLALIYICCHNVVKKHSSLTFFNLILIYLFNVWFGKNPLLGKILWLTISLNFFIGLYYSNNYIDHVIVTWILSSALLMRPCNTILLPICVYCYSVIQKYVKGTILATVINLWIARVFFFAQGNSNSLASVDVAAGYVGLESYIPSIVFLQSICHTYAFPVLLNLLTLRKYLHYNVIVWETCIFYRLLALVLTCVAVLIQRHHLFVWSVFAPKLFIESFNCIELLIEIVIFVSIKQIVNNKTVLKHLR